MKDTHDQPVTAGQLREILKDEREHTREIVRYEVARQLDEKLSPIHRKLDQIIETEDEDVRAMAGDVKKVDRRVTVLARDMAILKRAA